MRRSEKSKDTKARLAPKQKISYEKKPDPAITAYAVQSLNWLRQAEFLMSARNWHYVLKIVATRLRLPDVQMQENLAQLMH